jgi:hypothetical protein
MEKGRNYGILVGASLMGEMDALQRMFQLRDTLTQVFPWAVMKGNSVLTVSCARWATVGITVEAMLKDEG